MIIQTICGASLIVTILSFVCALAAMMFDRDGASEYLMRIGSVALVLLVVSGIACMVSDARNQREVTLECDGSIVDNVLTWSTPHPMWIQPVVIGKMITSVVHPEQRYWSVIVRTPDHRQAELRFDKCSIVGQNP